MSKVESIFQRVRNLSAIAWIYIAAGLVILFTLCFWYRFQYLGSNNVFWGMVGNNLSTKSITLHTVQDEQGQKVDQHTRLVFGSQNLAHTIGQRTTETQTGKTVIDYESIDTPDSSYSRYIGINTDGKKNTDEKVLGVWGKLDSDSATGFYQNSVISIPLYADFNAKQRVDLVRSLRDSKAFTIKAVKGDSVNGRAVYVYTVDINLEAYVKVLAEYAKALGMGDLGLESSQYAGTAPLNATFTIGKLSRQLVSLSYKGSTQKVEANSQGLETDVVIPSKTIPMTELQNRIRKSFN